MFSGKKLWWERGTHAQQVDMSAWLLGCCLQAKRQTQHGRALACAASQAVTEAAMAHGSHDNITTLTMLLDWDGQLL